MKKITRPLLLLLIPLWCLGQTASPTGFSYTPSVTVVGLFDAGNTDKATTEYCSVSGTGSYNPDKVRTTGGGQNIDHSAAKPTGNYKYYKGEKLVVAPGESFDLSVEQSNDWSMSMVWIDWNGDNDFTDNGEQVVVFGLQNQNNAGPFNATINVPANALPGLVRMRVLTGDAWVSNPSAAPCGEIASSATKDFVLEIVGKSVKPAIEWNSDIGKFSINSTTTSITIDQDSGIISWKSGLASGTYELTVTASNTYGTVTTTYSIEKQGTASPTEFSYSVSSTTVALGVAGSSVTPNINWNNHQGTFAFVGGVDPAIIFKCSNRINHLEGEYGGRQS